MDTENRPDVLESYEWEGLGYQPLLLQPNWMVSLLNWEPATERINLKEIERHDQTDEVFVILKGRSVLFVRRDGERLQAFDLRPGVIYNVPQGVWHNLVASREATLLIVENRDTHLYDTEIRPITPEELEQLDILLGQLNFSI
jgi:mannose-6-phosphate isomerase-like protein (cupin superfamily)